MRLALGIEYDGSRFLGWQTQPGAGTVQDALQAALSAIAGREVKVTCAGRTDRGVHAIGQVVHFDPPVARPESAWVRGVNAVLPDSVAALWVRAVNDGFHARFSALSRSYRYVLLNRAVRPALAARHAGWFHRELDVDAMRRAAELLVGDAVPLAVALVALGLVGAVPLRGERHERVPGHRAEDRLDLRERAWPAPQQGRERGGGV